MMPDRDRTPRELSAENRAALIKGVRAQARRDGARELIPKRAGAEPARASFSQERVWFLSQLAPDSPAYNVPVGLLIDGSLDALALRQGLIEMVNRHEALRTTFPALDGVPFQAVAPDAMLDVPVVDLSELPNAARRPAAAHVAAVEARRPFGLAVGPLIRATLMRLSDSSHALVLVMHHII